MNFKHFAYVHVILSFMVDPLFFFSFLKVFKVCDFWFLKLFHSLRQIGKVAPQALKCTSIVHSIMDFTIHWVWPWTSLSIILLDLWNINSVLLEIVVLNSLLN